MDHRWGPQARALVLILLLLTGTALASVAWSTAALAAGGNASSAAAFLEKAQTADGGFYETRGQGSNPTASLWATVALLAAGKNPRSELLNNGASAATYLSGHLFDYRSLTDLGMLAIVQAASGATPSYYGDPYQAIATDLTAPAIRNDPVGAAFGAIGLIALHHDELAAATANALVSDELSDGGWGSPGDSDSASTALVLEALAQTGVASSATGAAAVKSGITYLHSAQVNDGSIAASDRTGAESTGNVAATAFTIQALVALHHDELRTPTGITVEQGLTNYQQQTGNGAGGLSSFGAYATGVAPSVTQTAQAYPAFDGVALPLPYVAPTPIKAPTHPSKTATNRASVGSSSSGISSAGKSAGNHAHAYSGASAQGSTHAKAHRRSSTQPTGGQHVTGTTIDTQPAPKLASAAGRAPAADHTALDLALALLAIAVLGATLDSRRPRVQERHPVTVAILAGQSLFAAARRRRAGAPALALTAGLALILIPVFTGMWSRAPRGQTLIHQFAPYMREPHLGRLVSDVNVLDAAFAQTRHLPAVAHFAASTWPPTAAAFRTVLGAVTANRGAYESLAALPTFGLFPIFLVIPGVLLIALALLALISPRRWQRARLGVAVVGAALVLAPVALGLFSAGSQGAHLISAFAPVESRATVVKLQQGFSNAIIGESDVSSAVSSRAETHHYPAGATLERRWIRILGDLTPLLGVMSDNVSNYQAVAGLPSFTAFPWLFAGPGLLALLIALGAYIRIPPTRRLRGLGKKPGATAGEAPTLEQGSLR
jgi:hypothetical protein